MIANDDKHFVMLTFEANKKISEIHHRMPVLLNKETREMWLDPKKSFEDCYCAIIKSNVICSGDGLELVEVGSLVNKVKN